MQAAEPEKVTSAAESTEISTDKEKKEKVANDGDNYKKFRFGGYGEMVASFKDYGINRFYGAPEGNPDKHRNTISIPRFVLKSSLNPVVRVLLMNLRIRKTVSMKRRWKRVAKWLSSNSTLPV